MEGLEEGGGELDTGARLLPSSTGCTSPRSDCPLCTPARSSEAFFCFHTINAWEEEQAGGGTALHIDLCAYEDAGWFEVSLGSAWREAARHLSDAPERSARRPARLPASPLRAGVLAAPPALRSLQDA